VRLDSIFEDRPVDLLKVDVEGFEERVLAGATRLLNDAARAPRQVFIEVHPYAWPAFGTSSDSLLALLARCGYTACDLFDRPITRVDGYGEIVGRRL
jgi:hypothetical protein